jgi:HNH endonuclease
VMDKRIKYSLEQLEFLRVGYLSMNVRGLTRAFNACFKADRTEVAIKSALGNHRITCGRAHKDRLKSRQRKFSEEQEQFIRDNYPGRSLVELAAMFKGRFENIKTNGQIKSFVDNHGINSGRTGCFEKGQKPWNTGTKGLTGANTGSFKKGHPPANRKPIGSERICSKDGFILIKIAERNPYTGFSTRWKHKHVHVWEQENGPVPKGMVVAFRDGDKLNTEPENLMLLSHAELLRLNQHGYKDVPDELKPSVLALVKLETKTFARIKAVVD